VGGARGGGGWSAQTACPVASVNTRFASLLSGDVPAAQPLSGNFAERPWSEIAAAIPETLEAGAAATPPVKVTRHDTITALETSAVKTPQTFGMESFPPAHPVSVGKQPPAVRFS
jgi:hypothetical protein